MTLKELREKLAKEQNLMAQVFEEAGDDHDFSKVKCLSGTDSEKAAALKKINTECSKIQKEMEPLLEVEKARKEWNERNGIVQPMHPEAKKEKDTDKLVKEFSRGMVLFGDAFIKSPAVKLDNKHKTFKLPEDVCVRSILKTAFTTSAGWAPESLRTGRFVEEATRPIAVIDIIPMNSTGMAAVKYMEETTFTNNAAEAAEAAQYGEAALALTEQSQTVEKIGVFLPVTDEQLEDVQQVQGYLNNRLPFMIRQRLDSQIINGNGSTPNLLGILNATGVQTIAQVDNSGDLVTDVLYRAMTLIRVNAFANPSGIVMNPNDWETIRLYKTNDGIYVWGHPSEAGPERIFGLPVVQSTAITEKTALVGAFADMCEFNERRGIEVKVSDSHDDYFIKGKQAIRADMRGAMVTYRPAAFVDVTLT